MADELTAMMNLVREYVTASTSAAAELRKHFAEPNLLEAVNSGRIPRSGTLSPGRSYFFHGTGCRIESGDLDIDFDFGPQGRTDGFDAWRLTHYARSRPLHKMFAKSEATEAALQLLVDHGLASCPGWPPSKHLLYLKEAIN